MNKTVSNAHLLKVKKNLHIYTDKIACSTLMDFPTKNKNNKYKKNLNNTKKPSKVAPTIKPLAVST